MYSVPVWTMLTLGKDVPYEIEILIFFMLRTNFHTLFHLGERRCSRFEGVLERAQANARRASHVRAYRQGVARA